MNWKLGTPKKFKFIGIRFGYKCLVYWKNGEVGIEKWLGNRWSDHSNGRAGSNYITHHAIINTPLEESKDLYARLEEVEKKYIMTGKGMREVDFLNKEIRILREGE